MSRAEVEKQRMNSTTKSQQCDDVKNEYANQLQKTNEAQVQKLNLLLTKVDVLWSQLIKCFIDLYLIFKFIISMICKSYMPK